MPAISGGKFVVVGGASQVGSHIGEQLLVAGAREVVLLDNLSLGAAEPLQPLLADRRCSLVRGDVMRIHELFDALAGADGVFSVAALMASSISRDPWTGLDVNIRGLQNTLEACRYQGVKKVVLSSSAGVYGSPEDVPTEEDSPLRWQALAPAMALYCASKVVGESLARHYLENYGLDYVALRYTAVYGERQHLRALVGGHIGATCERVRSGLPAIIDGDGRQVYDYIYAGDLARANLMAMQSEVTGEGINICSGVEVSQNRVVELVAQACNTELKTEVRELSKTARLPATTRQVYSREKARRLLGWEPEVPIEEGVRRVLRWVDLQRAQAA
ncbi:MAG TPA: NAD-dependent epimerase/dehydratase family protein [Ramlibacter sp.]|nr:NAD-dependent epimerase/dehydratase family protein [Ramlibacter sp.]